MFNYYKAGIYIMMSAVIKLLCAVTRPWYTTVLPRYGVAKEKGVMLIKTLK
jgi:hypothetical protein